MKTIELTKGKRAIVDDADYERLSQYSWFFNPTGTGYAQRSARKSETGPRTVLLHRVVMNASPGYQIDHINRNTLDNRKENLRLCTQAQNMSNSTNGRLSSSGFRGVSYDSRKTKNPWRATVGKRHVGMYKTAEEAARAYDEAAIKHYGEFANTNFRHGQPGPRGGTA